MGPTSQVLYSSAEFGGGLLSGADWATPQKECFRPFSRLGCCARTISPSESLGYAFQFANAPGFCSGHAYCRGAGAAGSRCTVYASVSPRVRKVHKTPGQKKRQPLGVLKHVKHHQMFRGGNIKNRSKKRHRRKAPKRGTRRNAVHTFPVVRLAIGGVDWAWQRPSL